MGRLIDLGSDTATLPSRDMIAFMTACPLGDDQKGEDPTVNRLQEEVSALLGTEAALYLPSATMANEIAVKLHTRPGDQVILDAESHLVISEGGGPAFLSGVMLHGLAGTRGIFTAAQVAQAIQQDDPHCPRSSLVSVEQTTNRGGGAIWPQETLRAVVAAAHGRGLSAHLDGSRLMNAAVASGHAAAEHVQGFDSVTLCLSKGLGCPVGALLAGSRSVIREARRLKHVFGGAMRQAGIIAGAGLFALKHNVDRLAEDHANARSLATLLSRIPGIGIDPAEVETNIVFFDVGAAGLSGPEMVAALRDKGVRVGARPHETKVRAVTHLDVTREDILRAAACVAEVVEAARPRLPTVS